MANNNLSEAGYLEYMGAAALANNFIIEFPESYSDDGKVSYTVISTSAPEKTIGTVFLHWQGKKLKIAGNVEYSEWSCTFEVDEGYRVRSKIEAEMAKVVDKSGARGIPSEYLKQIKIKGLAPNQLEKGTWVLNNAFINSISGGEYDKESSDQKTTFTITVAFSDYDFSFVKT